MLDADRLAAMLEEAAARELGQPRAKGDPALHLDSAARRNREWRARGQQARLDAAQAELDRGQSKRVSTRAAKAAAHAAELVWRPDYLGGPCTREQADADIAARKAKATQG